MSAKERHAAFIKAGGDGKSVGVELVNAVTKVMQVANAEHAMQPAPQGVAEVMELVDELSSTRFVEGIDGDDTATERARALVEQAITALITERDTSREDAARYLWLRDAPQEKVEVYFATDLNETGWANWYSWKDKDAAIDAAIVSSKEAP